MSSTIYAKEYDDYLITGNVDSLKFLLPGSIEERYALLSRRIVNEPLTKELQFELEQFTKEFPDKSPLLNIMYIKKIYEQEPNSKDLIINKLKKFFHLSEPEPEKRAINYNTNTVNNYVIHYPSILDYSECHTLEKIRNNIYNFNLEDKDTEQLIELNPEISIDIKKVPFSLIENSFFDNSYKDLDNTCD